MSRQSLPEECDCTCHGDPDEEVHAHAMPCCMRCSHCGKAIEVGLWSVHSDACKSANGTAGTDAA